jgi:4-amino-4-deoxy-L-arabinose transferase-like glycosyltransferase
MPQTLPPRGAALLLAVVGALLVFRLGTVPLIGPDEPRYARVAVEMARSGDLVTPTLQGKPWLEKPALYYWLAAAAFKVLGETEAAARLPSVMATLLMVGATALVAARLFGGSAGLHAGFALGTAALPFVYARAASMDALLAAFVTLAIGLLGLRVLGMAGGLAVPAAAVAAALATLAKGPLGMLLPILVLGAYLLALRDRDQVRRVASPAAIFLFLVVALPWYLLIWRARGRAFLEVFVLDHNLRRFTSEIHHHPGPFYYYLPLILLGLFPWTPLLLPALARLRPRQSRVDLFLVLWLAVPLAFFSAAGSKLPGYLLPCLPPLAILIGRAADAMVTRTDGRIGFFAPAAIGVFLAALVAAAPVALLRLGDPGWSLLLPLAAWAVVTALAVWRQGARDPGAAVRLMRIGAVGFLLLLSLAAPSILDRRESGRRLFLAARGEEVLAWGAWRSAWMAGYYYNDGRVREADGADAVLAAVRERPTLVLCGPAERRQLLAMPALMVRLLAEGPRENTLLQVRAR